MTDNEITIKARGIARTLTYNDDTPQAQAKHMLLELSHRLDTRTLRVHPKEDGLLLVNGLGGCRFLTFKERVAFRFFKMLPDRV